MTQPRVALVPGTTGHYELLRPIINQPTASQHGLAARLGVSVGKVNYCLRALVDKGWVKANNFRRSDNNLTYAYLLSAREASLNVCDERSRPSETNSRTLAQIRESECRVL